jgi:prepilin peptidase CpaA
MNIYPIVAIAVALVAVSFDLSTRRIPNILTFGAALLGIAAHTYAAGANEGAISLAGWLVGVAIFFPVFALGGMGAGDVKLLGALGAWLGPVTVIWVGLYSGIAGGILGIIVAGYFGYLPKAVANVGSLVTYWRIMGPRPAPDLTLSTHRGPRLAYAVPVFTGLMVTIWFQ